MHTCTCVNCTYSIQTTETLDKQSKHNNSTHPGQLFFRFAALGVHVHVLVPVYTGTGEGAVLAMGIKASAATLHEE